jgi:hypothetical protein
MVRSNVDGVVKYDCVACKASFYSSTEGSKCVLCVGRTDVNRTTCELCPVGGLPRPGSAGLQCQCSEGYYALSQEGKECLACPANAVCDHPNGTTSATVRALPDFWQSSPDPQKARFWSPRFQLFRSQFRRRNAFQYNSPTGRLYSLHQFGLLQHNVGLRT